MILGVSETEEKEKGAESLFQEMMTDNSSIWGKIWKSKFRKFISFPKDSTQKDLFQNTL